MSMIKLPINNRGESVTVGVEYIAFVTKEPNGSGSLVHMGVRTLGMERRVRLAVVRTILSKDRVDDMLRSCTQVSEPVMRWGNQ